MTVGWIILTIGLAACAAGSAVYWCLVLVRIRRMIETAPVASDGLVAASVATGRVSVIVPAHNEEAVIEGCAASLRAQDHPDLELIFVLDRCTDRTAACLRRAIGGDDRCIVIENDSCPLDWAGKCNAARIGAERATGTHLLFTDADTEFHPSLVRAAANLAAARSAGLLSLVSSLSTERFFERVVQPVASMVLMRLYPLDRVNDPTTLRTFANGQFMLFERSVYEHLGGHAAVKDDLLEDIAFARAAVRAGATVVLARDAGMLRCRMYDTFAAFRQGWKRIFIEACKRKPDRMRRHALRLLFVAIGDPALRLAGAIVGAALVIEGHAWWGAVAFVPAILSAAVKGAALAWAYRLAGAPAPAIALHSWATVRVAGILYAGARDLVNRRPVRWGGREYILEPRG